MSYYVVSAAGNNSSGAATTSSPSGTEWTNAYTTLGAAITAANATPLPILVDVDHAETIAAGYSITHDLILLVLDKDNGNALTKMGETLGAITSNNVSMSVFIGSSRKWYLHGLTIKLTGGSTRGLTLFNGDNLQVETLDMTGWNASSNASSSVSVQGSADGQIHTAMYGYTDRRDNAAHAWPGAGNAYFYGGGLSASAAAVTTCFTPNSSDPGGTVFDFIGFNFSSASSTAYVVGDTLILSGRVSTVGCTFPASYTPMAPQTNASFATSELFINNCIAGSVRNIHGYANGLGSCITDDAVYVTAGVAGRSWRITTNSEVSPRGPFRTPWLDFYNTDTASTLKYFDVLRNNDSTTAYDNDELWVEFAYKATSGSELLTFINDGIASIIATPAAQDSSSLGAGDWTGESGSCWYGKLGVTFAAAEEGYFRARFCVGVVTAGTIFIDPEVK